MTHWSTVAMASLETVTVAVAASVTPLTEAEMVLLSATVDENRAEVIPAESVGGAAVKKLPLPVELSVTIAFGIGSPATSLTATVILALPLVNGTGEGVAVTVEATELG